MRVMVFGWLKASATGLARSRRFSLNPVPSCISLGCWPVLFTKVDPELSNSMMRCFNLLLSVATLCVGLISLWSPLVDAIPRRQFYPFGRDEGDSVLPRSDNGASEPIPVIDGFKYFGSSYTNLYVSLADIILYCMYLYPCILLRMYLYYVCYTVCICALY